jgi:hypothetical protein
MSGSYVHWGVLQISVTNLVIIAAMLVVFALAIIVPFGRGHQPEDEQDESCPRSRRGPESRRATPRGRPAARPEPGPGWDG